MEQTITFHIHERDKKLLEEESKRKRMSLSTFCRTQLIENIFQKALDGKLNLRDVEKLEVQTY